MEATRRERRGYPRASLPVVGEHPRCASVFGHDEPDDPRKTRVDAQKKTLGATERDEEARGAWRRRYGGVDPRRLVFVDEFLHQRSHGAAEGEGAQGPEGPREG